MKANMPATFRVLIIFALGILGASCAQTTYKASTYRQSVTTHLEITTNVPAEVRIADRVMGTTPLSFPLNYEEEVDRQVRRRITGKLIREPRRPLLS